jgi:hypothetical protein
VDIDAVIEDHGWALRAVLGDGPGVPPFTYSIGLFDRLPELLCIGPCAEVAGPTVNALARRLLSQPELALPGQQVELPTDRGALPEVRLGAVDARWRGLYVTQAMNHHGTDDIDILQVLVPDPDGRFPGDPDVDAYSYSFQPVLADPERPWRAPFGDKVLRYYADDGDPVDHAVLLPIIDAGEPIGREELVPAEPVDGGWQLTVQPSLADWCATDAVVAAVLPDEDFPGVDAEVVRFERVVRSSSREVLRWGTRLRSEQDTDRLWEIITAPVFYRHVSVGGSAAPHALTFATPPALVALLRRAFRPLERDGLLVPRSLFHAGEDADLAVPHPQCPHCQATKSGP